MLQIQYLRENTREAIERLQINNVFDAESRVEEILLLDNNRRELQHKADTIKAESNAIAKEIGK
ncbi:MAG: serine--tRNA ligase, partial [Bacteroidales bacterium]|nr:serine--tRNA ligase [Bacteroidales bacterium]